MRGAAAKKSVILAVAWLAMPVLMPPGSVRAQHACDAVTDEGWRVMPSTEVTGVKDGAPYPVGPDGAVDRTTTLLPLCNYFNAIGNYSLRSYALDPFDKTERVVLCRAGAPVAPYAGSCPPK
jgi:hypothetical protein